MNIKTLFAPKTVSVSVEQVHAEIDALEKKLFKEFEILPDLQIKKNQLEDKSIEAQKLKELGFTNCKNVEILKELEEVKSLQRKTSSDAQRIFKIKSLFVNEKIMRKEDFEAVCNKYNLIYAPVGNYIKDIPSKNIEEMHKAKKLTDFRNWNGEKPTLDYNDDLLEENAIVIDKIVFNDKDIYKEFKDRAEALEGIEIPMSKTKTFLSDQTIYPERLLEFMGMQGYRTRSNMISKVTFSRISKKGLFIAAPKDHFKLDGLVKNEKNQYFEGKKSVFVVDKDPIVFEHIKGGLIRVITKWGSETDLAYLDPALVNELMN